MGPGYQTGRNDQAVPRRPGHSWAGPCVAAARCFGRAGLGWRPWEERFLSQPGLGVLWGEPMILRITPHDFWWRNSRVSLWNPSGWVGHLCERRWPWAQWPGGLTPQVLASAIMCDLLHLELMERHCVGRVFFRLCGFGQASCTVFKLENCFEEKMTQSGPCFTYWNLSPNMMVTQRCPSP